jgi:hypothetical protein
MQPARIVFVLGVIALAVAGGGGIVFWTVRAGAGEGANTPPTRPGPTVNTPLHPVIIKKPAGAPKVATGLTNFHGEPVMASCASCHATTTPNREIRAASDLKKFHQGLKYAHGELSCLSCHNADNYEKLRRADSRSVEFADSMTLCSQCHGPQRRDYDMGLHGGMNGHWDLRRGGRTRNTCINCHDPHAPAFPLVMPVLPPHDRISVPKTPADHRDAKH